MQCLKRKRTKLQTMIYKTLHRNVKIEQHRNWVNCGRVSSSYSNSGTCHVTLVENLGISHERGKEDGIVTTTKGAYP